jgi:hypothetical protein
MITSVWPRSARVPTPRASVSLAPEPFGLASPPDLGAAAIARTRTAIERYELAKSAVDLAGVAPQDETAGAHRPALDEEDRLERLHYAVFAVLFGAEEQLISTLLSLSDADSFGVFDGEKLYLAVAGDDDEEPRLVVTSIAHVLDLRSTAESPNPDRAVSDPPEGPR